MDDVLICGAGPTGLVLALWLTQLGQRVRIIDRTVSPGTSSRAMAVQARTLELYQQLDLTQDVLKAGNQNLAMNFWVKGKKRAHVPFGDAGKDLTPFPFLMVYPQDQHEQLLIDKLKSLGIEVERGTTLVSFEDLNSHVNVVLKDQNGIETQSSARFLAGCDGASSTIRHLLNFGFEGGTYKQIFYVADVQIEGLTPNQAHIALDESDFVAIMSYGNENRYRLIGIVSDLSEKQRNELTFQDVQQHAIERLGVQIQSLAWFSTYKVHHRVTDHFAKDNVFLLGDAAHVHSPAGGQGMNTGILDAINLAWKLSAVLKQQASTALLKSYDIERRAFALKLVETTDQIFSFATADNDFANFIRTRIAPMFMHVAYSIDFVREFMFRILSQTMLEYRDSPISIGQAKTIHAGDRLPWVKLTSDHASNHTSIDNYTSLRHVGWQIHIYGTVSEEIQAWSQAHSIPLQVFAWEPSFKKAGFSQNTLYLLRPDTYIGFIDPYARVEAVVSYFDQIGFDLEKFKI